MNSATLRIILFCALLSWILLACGDDSPTGTDAGIDAASIADAQPLRDACDFPKSDAMAIDASLPDAGAADAGSLTCRSQADCGDGIFSCLGPNDLNCGIAPLEDCQSDIDCGNGNVCHVVSDSCSADGFGSECRPACSDSDSCGSGFTCDTDLGACRPLACDDASVECAPSQQCDPSSIDADGPVHGITAGCDRILCQDDTPCPNDTVCVNGYCQDGPGACSEPAPFAPTTPGNRYESTSDAVTTILPCA